MNTNYFQYIFLILIIFYFIDKKYKHIFKAKGYFIRMNKGV